MSNKVINFGAGPAKLPEEVLLQVQKELIQYGKSGISVMELSHRSKEYDQIHNNAIDTIKQLLHVPDNYKILLMQGGGSAQFSAVCMNLIGRTGVADYVVTGSWSAKAAKEATKFGKINMVIPKTTKFTSVPDEASWNLDPNASFLYYCDNETVDGVEFNFIPNTKGVPIVCDMSSNILSRPFDITKFGVIYGGAQKNIGPAGITVTIVRDDLIGNANPLTPLILDYSVMAKDNSLHNTPPTFNIYVMGLVFKWIEQQGGLEAMHKNALLKSQLIYNIVQQSDGFYYAPVEKVVQSRMNIPFRIGGAEGNKVLEEEFLKGAEAKHMVQLRGHRSVGGIRASLYNAVSIEEVKILADYMQEFYENNCEKIKNGK